MLKRSWLSILGLLLFVMVIVAGCGSGGGGSSPPANIGGTWSGSWSSSVVAQSGSVAATVSQSGTTFSGNISIGNSPCFSNGTITGGIVSGNRVSWSATGIGNFSGTVFGTSLTGTYSVTLAGICFGDNGNFSVTIH